MNKRRLVFAVDEASFYKEDHIGVRKKVQMQCRMFEKNGLDVTLKPYSWNGNRINFPVDDDTDILYFRRISASYRVGSALLALKKKNPDLKIVMEIPAYPFDKERKGTISIKQRLNEAIGTYMWRLCLDRIALIDNHMDKLYGVPVLTFHNGLDFESVRCRKTEERESISLIAVSGCFPWHGYDRLIRGLGEYYKQEVSQPVDLYIVGEGECSPGYRELSDSCGLTEEHVFFCGIRDGAELDEVFDKSDLAVDCLALHRKGVDYSSSLKSREYVAKGLPIIASNDFDIEKPDTAKWFLKLPADESDIDINRIVEYYKEIYPDTSSQGKESVARSIRETFRPLCDINDTFREVLDYIKG